MKNWIDSIEVPDEAFTKIYTIMLVIAVVGMILALIGAFISNSLFMLGVFLTIAPTIFDRFMMYLTFRGD